jgi:hypothetical protein
MLRPAESQTSATIDEEQLDTIYKPNLYFPLVDEAFI